ncbi:hypothetical protein HYU40_05225 [Candidatus Woesearchaeota archaeon]|nr:hypothetical protein [Candidatus Woesearchaeota archaeon]
MSRNGNDIAGKLEGIKSSRWFAVCYRFDELSHNGNPGGRHYVVGFPTPMGGGKPVELVGRDFYGFVQRALVAADVNGRLDSHQTDSGGLEITLNTGKRERVVATVALYERPQGRQGRGEGTMNMVSVTPSASNSKVGPFGVVELVKGWGAQLPKQVPTRKDVFARYATPQAQLVAAGK